MAPLQLPPHIVHVSYRGNANKYVNACGMNRAHHHQLAPSIQAMFPGPKSKISSQNRRLKKDERREGLLIKVGLTGNKISIKRQSSFPM